MTFLRRSTSPRGLGVLGCLVFVCVFLGGAGTGAADTVTVPTPCPSPDKAKRFCITVSDTDGLSRSPVAGDPLFMESTVIVRSTEKSRSLTHARLRMTLVDVLAGGGTTGTTATLFETEISPDTTCGPLMPDGTITCDLVKLTPGEVWVGRFLLTTSINVDTVALRPVATRLTARVSVDERERDNIDPQDPNQEVREVVNPTVYSVNNAGGTVVPAGVDRHFSVPTSTSSLEFDSVGTLSFAAFITDHANDQARCFKDPAGNGFPGVPCLLQTSEVTVGAGAPLFGAGNPLQWIRQIVDPPGGLKPEEIDAIHRYDGITVTADAASDTFTAPKSFVNIDGVRFSTTGKLPAPLQAGVDYYVVQADGMTFKVSATLGGTPINLTNAGSGTTAAERIRVIGDALDGSERATSCDETLTKVPSIFGTKISNKVIQECVSDVENGYMK
jgi:hypothetical protein